MDNFLFKYKNKISSQFLYFKTSKLFYNKLTLIFIKLLLKVSLDSVSQSSDRRNKSDTKMLIHALNAFGLGLSPGA